jgi:hypothetical protein
MKIDVRDNFPELDRALARDFSQVPFALARALTRTAQQVREAERAEVPSVFDRPTPYTLNSFFVRPATKQKLEALVWVKDQPSGKGSHPMKAQIEGGDRGLKRFEFRLVRAGLMRANERAVAAGGAQLDRFGNISRGQIVKILSQLKTAAVVGDTSDATDSRRSRAKRANEAYFVSRGRGSWTGGGAWKNGEKSQHLPRGIWVRRSFGPWGSAVKPVLIFVDQTTYAKRFKFYETAQRVIERNLVDNFNQSFADATRGAKP